ncbi:MULTISPECIES: nitroreductase family protein [unclassified Archaeoglobus]|jgi:nitroreductase|uniref:nitroreductase family protein n=1 Tax=unclassified Archaeoglobus TaxID=2643606 RepID=UPI0025BC66D3|nr:MULTISPECIES: nitroreductase family protein [unclassified Archaeoglobus]
MKERLELIFKRVSIRRFTSDDIDDKTLQLILEAANAAPSAGNLQARDFVVVRDKERKIKLAKAALKQMFIAEAPVVVVVCANYPRSMRVYGERGKLYAEQDATAAVENILLAVTALDLGAVWVGAFDEREVSRILNLPEFVRPMAIVPIGHPAENPGRRSRYPVSMLTHYETW